MPEGRKRKGIHRQGNFLLPCQGVVCYDYGHSWKGENRFPQSERRQRPYKTGVHVKRPISSLEQEQCQKRVGAEGHAKTALSWLSVGFLSHKREREPLLFALQNWDTTEENACLCVENSYIFLLSQLCAETERFCPAHATRTAQRAEQLTVRPLTLLLGD